MANANSNVILLSHQQQHQQQQRSIITTTPTITTFSTTTSTTTSTPIITPPPPPPPPPTTTTTTTTTTTHNHVDRINHILQLHRDHINKQQTTQQDIIIPVFNEFNNDTSPSMNILPYSDSSSTSPPDAAATSSSSTLSLLVLDSSTMDLSMSNNQQHHYQNNNMNGIITNNNNSTNNLKKKSHKSVDFATLPPTPKRMRHSSNSLHKGQYYYNHNQQQQPSSSSTCFVTTTASADNLAEVNNRGGGSNNRQGNGRLEASSSSSLFLFNDDDDIDIDIGDGSIRYDNNNNINPSIHNPLLLSSSISNTTITTPMTIMNNNNQHDCCWNARQVVDAISTCISSNERIEAIQNTIEALNHHNEELHNEEMSTGIDSALTKHLTFLVYQHNIQQQQQAQQSLSIMNHDDSIHVDISNYYKEISLTLVGMEFLFRASSQIIGISFHRMGNTLLQILIKLMDHEIQKRNINITLHDQHHQLQKQIHMNDIIITADTMLSSETAPVLEATTTTITAIPDNDVTNNAVVPNNKANDSAVSLLSVLNYNDMIMNDDEKSLGHNIDDVNSDHNKKITRISSNNSGCFSIQQPLAPPPTLGMPKTSTSVQTTSTISTPPSPAVAISSTICIENSKTATKTNHVDDDEYSSIDDNQDLVSLCHDIDGDNILLKTTKILAHFARVGNATKSIAYYPNLLTTLLSLINVKPYECIPWEARLSALWIIANLACNQENMTMLLVNTPNLISTLVAVANRKLQFIPNNKATCLERTMEILRSRSIASRALLNLSYAPENKVYLSEQNELIDLLCDFISCRTLSSLVETNDAQTSTKGMHYFHHHYGKSKTIQEIIITTRRYASGALRNIAASPRKIKIHLCHYNNGHILKVLTNAAFHNDNDDIGVLERVFGTLHNLSNQDTAEMIVSHPTLVLAIKNALLSSSSSDDDDVNALKLSDGGDYSSSHINNNELLCESSPLILGNNNHDNINTKMSSQQQMSALLEKNSPKEHASAILTILQRSITSDMATYESLRTLLDAVNPTIAAAASAATSSSSSSATASPTHGDDQDDKDLLNHHHGGYNKSSTIDDPMRVVHHVHSHDGLKRICSGSSSIGKMVVEKKDDDDNDAFMTLDYTAV